MNNLVIVESPGKRKKIARILGDHYHVMASVGHVCDLPEDELGIAIHDRFLEHYEVTRPDVVKELKRAAEKADIIYLATDPDREGEAIAWHLSQLLPRDATLLRITFNQITAEAVQSALANPRAIDEDLVSAQRARRILGRLVGYLISPLLGDLGLHGKQPPSAGRVQTAGLRVIVEREREARAFRPQTFWAIAAQLEHPNGPFQARLADPACITQREGLDAILDSLRQARLWWVHSVTAQVQETNPPAPFTTSTLQQAASRQLNLTPGQTDQTAQQLYEAGLVTYIRTDALHIAPEAQAAAREVIRDHYGLAYLPEQPPIYQSKSNAQGAHEAIRPSHPEHLIPDELEAALDQVTLDLYTLIWRRFVASQMAPARRQIVEAQLRAGPDQANPLPYTLLARARVMLFPGYQAVYEEAGEPDESGDEAPLLANLPAMAERDALRLQDLETRQSQTRPPKRYSPARLVAELERLGIGRPSTYSATLETLLEREYATLKGRHVVPTALGEQTLDLLLVYFPQVFDLGFTASLESLLDHIAQGDVDRKSVLSAFYSGTLSPAIEVAQSAARQSRQLGQACPRCSVLCPAPPGLDRRAPQRMGRWDPGVGRRVEAGGWRRG